MDDQNNKVDSGVQSPAPVAGRPLTNMEAAIDALSEARDFIDRYADVKDGDYGVPEPNDAMVMVHEINATIEQLSRPASDQPVEAIGAGREGMLRDLRNLRAQFERIAAKKPEDQPHYRDGVRPFGTGDLQHFIATLTNIEAALSLASPARTPMGERGDVVWRDVKDAPQDGTNILLKHRVHGIIEGWFSKGEWTGDTPISPREYTGDMWILGDDLAQEEVEFGPNGEILAGSVEGWLPLDALAAPTPMGGEVEALREALEGVVQYASDTLSGRVGAPQDIRWHREGWKEIRARARQALAASSPSPAQGWEAYDRTDVRYGLQLIADEECDEVAASYYAKKALAVLSASPQPEAGEAADWSRDLTAAPEGEAVLLATSAGHVGEAIAPVRDDPDDDWFWAGAGFVHANHKPVAWKRLPTHPDAPPSVQPVEGK